MANRKTVSGLSPTSDEKLRKKAGRRSGSSCSNIGESCHRSSMKPKSRKKK
jgi:hypothetical protein